MVHNSFKFTGEPYDSNDLIFLKTIYYDPAIGRFLSRDTYLGTLDDPLSQDLYTYVGNNPVLYVDPSGNLAICSYDPKQQTAELRHQLETENLSLWERIRLWREIKWTEQPVILINFAPNTNISFLGGTGVTKNIVYTSRNADGVVKYAGITNNLTRRAAEQLSSKGIHI